MAHKPLAMGWQKSGRVIIFFMKIKFKQLFTLKRLLIFISLFVYNQVGFAQKNPFSKPIMEQGQKMANFLVAKNYDGLISFMYPKIVTNLGGKEELKRLLSIRSRQILLWKSLALPFLNPLS